MNANIDIIDYLSALFSNCSILYGVLSSPKTKNLPQKVTIKPIFVQDKVFLQMSTYFKDKVFHKNYLGDECFEIFNQHLKNDFKQATIFTQDADIQLLINKKGGMTVLNKPPTKKNQPVSHNRQKKYLLEEGIPFLIELGISSASGKVLDKKRDKFTQINRFLELFEDLFTQMHPRDKWHIVDFGCGKAYLTFALYFYLKEKKGLNVEMIGIDLKRDVIEFCQNLAKKLGYHYLKFKCGDINEHTPETCVDIMISLHACDTATDAALEKAVQWKAEAILSVPCCQHELYSQVSNSNLDPLFKHGILKERMAALVTDAARGQLLEILGYKTQILEFVDLDSTAKNLMIRALFNHKKPSKMLVQKYLEFKKLLNITPSLERRFHDQLGFQDSLSDG